MTDLPSDFDLKMLPDWLKNPAPKNPYSNYSPEERTGSRDRRPGRGRERDSRGGPQNARPKSAPSKGERRNERGSRRPERREHTAPQPKLPPLNVSVEFLPEPHFVNSLAKQIKTSGRAYPLLELARMFMDKPERHRVRLIYKEAPLFQCADNVSLDRAEVESRAFQQLKETYYAEEVSEREPVKGNFSSVARCKLSGTLLGPTNHHSYQPALHRLYEERFSRRMSFQQYTREIEIVSDPAVVEAWKDAARKVITYRTLKETEPLTFASETEAERHFRSSYLPTLTKSGSTADISGLASRSLADRRLFSAVRTAWERQRGFPGQIMHHLRQRLQHMGLHWFRHEGSSQFLSGIRPVPFDKSNENISESIKAIFKVVEINKSCNRATLAAALLPAESPDLEKLKATLAADLHWLIDAGHVLEFVDGRIILAPALVEKPKKTAPNPPQPGSEPITSAESAVSAEPTGSLEASSSDAAQPAAEHVADLSDPAPEPQTSTTAASESP